MLVWVIGEHSKTQQKLSAPDQGRAWTSAAVADMEGCFGILFSILYRTENPKAEMPKLAMEIASKILDTVDDRAPLRLRL